MHAPRPTASARRSSPIAATKPSRSLAFRSASVMRVHPMAVSPEGPRHLVFEVGAGPRRVRYGLTMVIFGEVHRSTCAGLFGCPNAFTADNSMR